jgi:[ribosomal protein S18]-alanine N-acetyltransferase
MTIRSAGPNDLDAVLALARACFGAAAWTAEQFAPHPRRILLVAELSAQTCAGYAVVELIGEEVELQSLAVEERHRRLGIGAALLAAARAAATRRGGLRMYLEVRVGNLAAQGFYRRFGFAETGRRPHYYRDPDEAAVLMQTEC